MPASPEMIAVKHALESLLPRFEEATGVDIGYADEEAPDPDDLAVQVFVRDASAVPAELDDLLAGFGVPIRVRQRRFEATAATDTSMHRPVVGGVSVGPARFADTENFPVGTLGVIGLTTRTVPPIVVGLSNHHVLAHDANRAFDDKIIQPEPNPYLGRLPGDLIGRLLSWEFPEIVFSGVADAAICSIDLPVIALPSIADIGVVAGTASASLGMPVMKRGRTTGLTHGIVTSENTGQPGSAFGTYYPEYPHLPPVNNPHINRPTIRRELRNQVQVMVDFPQSIVFGESGDSGSVVVDSGNRIVGLYFASGLVSDLGPMRYGLMTPIQVIEDALGVAFGVSF